MTLRLTVLAATMAAAAGLSACAYDEAYYGPPVAYADMDYSAYYDGFYGPFYGGYWGSAGRFYYWDQAHMRYHRDAGRHFSHEGGPGYNPIHGHAPPTAGHARTRHGASGGPH